MTQNLLSHKQVTNLIKAVGATRTVLIEGEAGSGKTAIAHEFKNDPFFDKPYEAPVRSAEAAAPAAPDPLRKSANIKPKRVMAALFKSTT